MAVSMSVRAQGVTQVEQRLAGISKRVADMSELMGSFGLYLESSTVERFDDEVDPDGKPWTPSVRALKENGKTLTDDSILRGSFAHIATKNSVEWGSNLAYARRHQEGFDGTEEVGAHDRTIRSVFGRALPSPRQVHVAAFTRQANTPVRAFLGVNASDEFQLLGLAEDYLAEAAGGAA